MGVAATLPELSEWTLVAKKHLYVYCFHGKHFTCWDLRGMLETSLTRLNLSASCGGKCLN